MLKHTCDICQKELDIYKRIEVHAWERFIFDGDYCIPCFQNKKNWNAIHTLRKKKKV